MTNARTPESTRDMLHRLTPGLRRFARALLGGRAPDHADDMVQNVITRALNERLGDEVALKHALYSWLVRLNRQRIRGPIVTPPEHAANDRGDRRSDIVTGIDHLGLEEREALLLVVLEGFSYDSAAQIAGVPRDIIVTRLMRARAALVRAGADGIAAPRGHHLRVVK